jgi:hypothetical protein
MTGNFSMAALAAAMSFAGTIQAEEIGAKCTGVQAYSADAISCLPRVGLAFPSAGPANSYAALVSAPASACSDLTLVFYKDRPAFRRDRPASMAKTYRLGPGQSQIVPIGAGYAKGDGTIQVAAILHEGSCRGRAAMHWRANVSIMQPAS